MNLRPSLLLVLTLTSGLLACHRASPDDDMVGVSITGIDHLPEHLSVQEFSVNGYHAFQAGQGGSIVCCAMLPRHWRPDLKADIRWAVTNWRDKTYYDRQEMVPVDQYSEAGKIFVHFLANGKVRVVSVIDYNARSSLYKGPHDPIPNKDPWHKYPRAESDPDFRQIPAPPSGASP